MHSICTSVFIIKNPQGRGKRQTLTFPQAFVIAVAGQKSSKLPVILTPCLRTVLITTI